MRIMCELGLPHWFWLAVSFVAGGNLGFLVAGILMSGRERRDD